MAFDRVIGTITRHEDGLLQSILDSFKPDDPARPPGGGVLRIGRGDFYGNLRVDYPGTRIEGEGDTIIHGSILCTIGNCSFSGLTIRGEGQPYAMKLYRTPSGGVARCSFDRCYFGAEDVTARNAGIGPVAVGGIGGHGLWLDSAILADARDCTFASCQGSGLYVNTSDPTGSWSTNINNFNNCTFNSNTRAGVEFEQGIDGIGGMMLLRLIGGNAESNTIAEILGDSMTNLVIDGMDFETRNSLTSSNVIQLNNCSPVLIANCNFVKDPTANVARMFLLSGCVGGVVRNCRESGTGWGPGAVGVFSDTSLGCYAEDFRFSSPGCYVNNRGYV